MTMEAPTRSILCTPVAGASLPGRAAVDSFDLVDKDHLWIVVSALNQ
jgi:hypothetical protein